MACYAFTPSSGHRGNSKLKSKGPISWFPWGRLWRSRTNPNQKTSSDWLWSEGVSALHRCVSCRWCHGGMLVMGGSTPARWVSEKWFWIGTCLARPVPACPDTTYRGCSPDTSHCYLASEGPPEWGGKTTKREKRFAEVQCFEKARFKTHVKSEWKRRKWLLDLFK